MSAVTAPEQGQSAKVDAGRPAATARLRQRAAALRQQARSVDPLVRGAYRRRAAELELAAWVMAIQSGADPASVRLAA